MLWHGWAQLSLVCLPVYRFATKHGCGYSVSTICILADGHSLLAWQCARPHSLHARADLLAALAPEALHGCTCSRHALATGARIVQGCCSEEEQDRSIWQTGISCHWSAFPPDFCLQSVLHYAVKAQYNWMHAYSRVQRPRSMLYCVASSILEVCATPILDRLLQYPPKASLLLVLYAC